MPKMQVYLPDALYDRVKSKSSRLNVSGVLQDAISQRLDELDRLDALAAAVASYEADCGAFSDAELSERAEADERAAIRPRAKKASTAA